MFSSKREISKSNGRTGDNLSKRESPVQKGRVGMYVCNDMFSMFSEEKLSQAGQKIKKVLVKNLFTQTHLTVLNVKKLDN